jgi:serine/threonine-protein kinase Chk1
MAFAAGSEVDLFYGGKVKVGVPIAQGGFSMVYSCFFGDIPAALKIITKKCGDFEKEVNLLATLNHPNVVRLLGFLQTDQEMLVMERHPIDLIDHLAQRPSLEATKHLVREFYAGLEYLHSEGVAHLDLKLENLLLTGTGSVVICDFGFATREKWSTLQVGTSGYVAPEVFYVKHLGAYDTIQADLWSASIVAFSIALGYMPFESRYGQCPNYRLFRKHPAVFWSKIDSEWVDFLAWLIQFAPAHRRKHVRHPFL